MHTKTKGDISEAYVTAALMAQGKTILKPMGDNARYDLVMEESGSFARVQCKTARYLGPDSGSLTFATRSSHNHTTNKKMSGYKGQADYFAVFFPPEKRIFIVPVNDAPNSAMNLRLKPSKNNQLTGTHNASDFEIF